METPPAFALLDLVEILWLPLVIGLVTAAVTWSIWYYTNVPCPAESAALHYCNPARLARYIDVEIWARCLTLGTLAGGLIGGGVNYAMFSRERAARIAAETIAAEERKLREEERRMREEERRMREEERRLHEEDRQRIDQLVIQFGETQQAMLSAITALTAEVSELRRQRNGENVH